MLRPSSFQEVEAITNADEIKQLSCSEVLRSRGKKFCLFTPALLVTHGGFDRDPVIEFDARYQLPAEYRPFCIQLKRENERFFAGLGVKAVPGYPPVDWERRLYAIDEEYAGDCFEFIGGIAWSDPKHSYFANVMSYDMMIPDPTSRRHEMLTVKVFGVMGNRFLAYLEDRVTVCPIARCVPYSGGALPAKLPRTNFLGVPDREDPLKMREDD